MNISSQLEPINLSESNHIFDESFISNVESTILQPLNFIKFEQYNEYFILKKMDINIIDYMREVKPLISQGINFNLLNYLINISNLSNSEFNIPVSSLYGYGITLNDDFTLHNKWKRFKNEPINPNDNIKKSLKKCKLKEHIDFEMIRGSIENEHPLVDIEYYITKEAFYKIIIKKIGAHVFKIMVESSTKIIFYYNHYRQKYNSTKMDELHKSMINMTNELHKLTQQTVNHTNGNYDEDIISTDSNLPDIVMPNDYLNNIYQISSNNEIDINDYNSDKSSEFSISSEIDIMESPIPMIESINSNLKHSLDEIKNLRHTITTQTRLSDLAYTFLDNERRTVAKTELCNINTKHLSKYNKDILNIHKSFKDVINGVNSNRLKVVNNSFITINENINSIIDSIEFSDAII